jgi:hypothetical protein
MFIASKRKPFTGKSKKKRLTICKSVKIRSTPKYKFSTSTIGLFGCNIPYFKVSKMRPNFLSTSKASSSERNSRYLN